MNLLDVVSRNLEPKPWAEGEKIPWSDPAFSARMLREHLSQAHNAASRKDTTIEAHVDWIHRALLNGYPSNILDLGCGPGLYTIRLAKLGHTCRGIDYGPASIAYARTRAKEEQLACTYLQEDIRQAAYGSDYDLVMSIFGEFNVFRPAEARTILQKARLALSSGGLLLLEVHTFDAVRRAGLASSTWSASENGLFSEKSHLYLQENFWNADQAVAISRYYTIEATSSSVTRHAASMQAYSRAEYQALLEACGFHNIAFHPSLRGSVDESQPDFQVIVAKM